MNKLGLFAFAAQFAPRLFQVRRRTWIGVGVGLLVLFVLMIWAGLALLGWLFGQVQSWMGGAPEAARGAIEQVEQAVPGTREKLGEFVPALKPVPLRRDVSGSDLGPVARYPGLARSYWQRDGELSGSRSNIRARPITLRYSTTMPRASPRRVTRRVCNPPRPPPRRTNT